MARHKLVIIGNGFDLAHNLNTKYSDFLKEYVTQAVNTVEKSPEEKYFGDLLYREGGALSKKTKLDDFNLVELCDDIVSNGYVLKPFLSSLITKLKMMGSLNWVDIEYEYFIELSKIYRKITNFEGDVNKVTTQYTRLKNLNISLNYTKMKLVDYLKSESKKNGMVKNDKIKEHIDSLMRPVAFGNKNRINIHGMSKTFFLNFNYTSKISDYLEIYDKKDFNYEVVNIHGSIDDVNSIIFGYGDMMDARFKEIENYNDNNFFRNIKQFYYLQSDAYHKLISFMRQCDINNKYDIHIMGHSCGMSDRVLFNKIFNRDKCEKIYLYYHMKKEGDDDFFEKIINISRHFDEKNKEYFIEMMATKADCKTLT